jgi:hypothetical protein
MAEGNETQQNSNPQSAGDEGGNDRKLFAGKFKTAEDMEKGYQELERSYHGSNQSNRELREEFGELKELVVQTTQQLTQRNAPQSYGNTSREGFAAPAQMQQANAKIVERLLTDPMSVLNEVSTAAEERAVARLSNQSKAQANNEREVAEWAGENEDVTPYRDLMSFYVAQQNQNLSTRTKLDKAAKLVRARVQELRGKPQSGGPNPGDHIEGPSGSGVTPNQPNMQQTQQVDPERELAKVVAQRNAARRPKPPSARA